MQRGLGGLGSNTARTRAFGQGQSILQLQKWDLNMVLADALER